MSYFNTSWCQGMQRVPNAINDAFGEALTIIPSETRPNYPPQQDYKHAVTVQGVFSYRSAMALDTGHDSVARRGHHPGAIVETRTPIARFAHKDLKWALNHGDIVRREIDGTEFTITALRTDGVSAVECDLVQLGVQEQ